MRKIFVNKDKCSIKVTINQVLFVELAHSNKKTVNADSAFCKMLGPYRCGGNRSGTDTSSQNQNLSRIQSLFCESLSKTEKKDIKIISKFLLNITELKKLILKKTSIRCGSMEQLRVNRKLNSKLQEMQQLAATGRKLNILRGLVLYTVIIHRPATPTLKLWNCPLNWSQMDFLPAGLQLVEPAPNFHKLWQDCTDWTPPGRKLSYLQKNGLFQLLGSKRSRNQKNRR